MVSESSFHDTSVIKLGVLLEIDTQSCILVRIRTHFLKIWGIQ
jgi:hypothetical protein